MNVDAALQELGHDATSEEARRAYLRLLKSRKPEVDPEGFQRLRAAYELAKRVLDWRGQEREMLAADDAPVGESPAPAPAPVVADSPPLAPGLPLAGPEALPPLAPSPRDEPAPTEPPAAATAPLVSVLPALPPIDEIRRLLNAGDTTGASPLLAERYDAACASRDVELPPVFVTLEVLLDLLVKSHPSAERLHAAFARWLDVTGLEVTVMKDRVAAIWLIVQELFKLPARFDRGLRAAIAEAVRKGDVNGVKPTLRAYRARSQVTAAETAGMAAMLRTHTTFLAATLATELDGRARPVGKRHGSGGIIAVSMVVLAILRACASLGDGPSQDTNVPTYSSPTSRLDLTPEMTTARFTALRFGAAAQKRNQTTLQAYAFGVAEALASHDCRSARYQMDGARIAVDSVNLFDWPDAPNELAGLERDFRAACGGEKSGTLDAAAATDAASAKDAARPKDAGRAKLDDPCGGVP